MRKGSSPDRNLTFLHEPPGWSASSVVWTAKSWQHLSQARGRDAIQMGRGSAIKLAGRHLLAQRVLGGLGPSRRDSAKIDIRLAAPQRQRQPATALPRKGPDHGTGGKGCAAQPSQRRQCRPAARSNESTQQWLARRGEREVTGKSNHWLGRLPDDDPVTQSSLLAKR